MTSPPSFLVCGLLCNTILQLRAYIHTYTYTFNITLFAMDTLRFTAARSMKSTGRLAALPKSNNRFAWRLGATELHQRIRFAVGTMVIRGAHRLDIEG